MAVPSKVLVPLPNSSMRHRLFDVACVNANFISSHSTRKVDLDFSRSSYEPIREKILSNRGNLAYFAVTKHPIWPRITFIAIWRIKVDFPPIFGPLNKILLLFWSNSMSFLTKSLFELDFKVRCQLSINSSLASFVSFYSGIINLYSWSLISKNL